MLQAPLPEYITQMTDSELHELVRKAKRKLGNDVLVLGHHYQRDEVIEHADHTGDSLKLARIAHESQRAIFVVFCGVHFMAETADIMAHPNQKVCLPDLEAGCDMADMAIEYDVRTAWNDAASIIDAKRIIPVTYVNSKASLKAFVGDKGGTVCTSSNADKVITWAMERGNHLFFFPDQHLGRNVCKRLGLDPSTDMLIWNPNTPFGGHSPEKLAATKIWLWQGHCPVHALFTVEQIQKLRADDPHVKIIVHPECAMEIVDLADGVGSTEQLIKMVHDAQPGSAFAVGTEVHLVERLAKTYPDKRIFSLNRFSCLCATMNRISIGHLAWVMSDLADKGILHNQIAVPEIIAKSARVALTRMFELS